MELTAEQRDIVDFPLRHGEILKVVAFAGTGKTTVLEQFARARPSLRLLYVAFNKSVQQEAWLVLFRRIVLLVVCQGLVDQLEDGDEGALNVSEPETALGNVV